MSLQFAVQLVALFGYIEHIQSFVRFRVHQHDIDAASGGADRLREVI